MFSMSKIIADLIQGYSLKIAAAGGAVFLASSVFDYLSQVAAPVSKALGGQ